MKSGFLTLNCYHHFTSNQFVLVVDLWKKNDEVFVKKNLCEFSQRIYAYQNIKRKYSQQSEVHLWFEVTALSW